MGLKSLPKILNKSNSGFTIVELLIVIVVIAILAAIATISYNGIQSRSKDSQRKVDTANIAKLITMSQIEYGYEAVGRDSGCGGSGQGSGYFTRSYGSDSYRSVQQCLIDFGYTSAADIGDPSGCDDPNKSDSCHRFDGRYMIAVCEKDGQPASYVLAKLETEEDNTNLMREICDPNTVVGWPNTAESWSGCEDVAGQYCMNYAVRAY